MKNKSWSREDVVRWLQECACQNKDDTAGYQEGEVAIGPFPYGIETLHNEVMASGGIDVASCPESYIDATKTICNDPYAVLEKIKPIMDQVGVTCPQSFARAMYDVFNVGKETGIIKI